MKKIFLIITIFITLFCLCGCDKHQENKYSEGTYYSGDRFTIFVDEETCVEYFVSEGGYNRGDVMPRYNQDGTLKINKKCLNDLESKGE